MTSSPTRGSHRAPGPAVIDYRGIVAPMGRGLGSAVMIGAVAASGAVAAQAAPATTVTGNPVLRSHLPLAPVSAPTEVLRHGSRGDNVKVLQEKLNQNGYKLEVDGSFGGATLRAVRAYQGAKKLSVDGVVGKRTWATLFSQEGATAPAPAPTANSQSTTVLKYGMRSDLVKEAQNLLIRAGQSIAADGSFGPATLKAVRAFQSANNLSVDGVVGPNTWSALRSSTPAAKAPSSDKPAQQSVTVLKFRMHSDAVKEAQNLLIRAGFKIDADGSFGPATLNAVREFQRAKNLGVDGVVGPNTWAALRSNTGPVVSPDSGKVSRDKRGQETPGIGYGARGKKVSVIQGLLRGNGYWVPVDGAFGTQTRNAVQKFQRAEGLPATGVVDDTTMDRLYHPGHKGKHDNDINHHEGRITPEMRASIVALAKKQLGIHYVWGGTTPAGFDCSGLTQWVYAQHGIKIPRVSWDQVYAGTIIPESEALPGDLVAFTKNGYGHIGIYAGDGMIIDAPYTGRDVSYRKIWNSPHVFVTYR